MGHFVHPRDDFIIKDIIHRIKPKRILEIGLNMGHSATMWLHYSNANLVSVDPCLILCDSKRPNQIMFNVKLIEEYYPNRFMFIKEYSSNCYKCVKHLSFDLLFLDGSHESEILYDDIILSLSLNIQFVFIDDVYGKQTDCIVKHDKVKLIEITRYFENNKHRILYGAFTR